MINLDSITLVGIDGVGNDGTYEALAYSSKNLNFKEVKFFSSIEKQDSFCEVIRINKLTYREYNKFLLCNLHEYINTEFLLLVQPDGFVINPHLWTDEFLQYHYIGAPWQTQNVSNYCYFVKPQLLEQFQSNSEIYQVGNGGFSLRSKQFLKRISDLYVSDYDDLAEDIVTGVVLRERLEDSGFKFATVDMAAKFSLEECSINKKLFSTKNSFGFHGKHQHPELLNLKYKNFGE